MFAVSQLCMCMSSRVMLAAAAVAVHTDHWASDVPITFSTVSEFLIFPVRHHVCNANAAGCAHYNTMCVNGTKVS
jgi:hypothetical protein